MVAYLFIDESGDLGMKGSKYLVLSCLIVNDDDQLNRIIKNTRRNKFKNELKNAYEIKANKSSPTLICYLLEKLNECDAKVCFVVLEKKYLFSDFLKENKHKLYNFVAGKLAKQMNLNHGKVVVRIDKSKGKQVLKCDFNNYFESNLRDNSSITDVEIHHSYSHSWAGLQFADLLAWSLFQKFEHGNDTYIRLIRIEKEVYYVW